MGMDLRTSTATLMGTAMIKLAGAKTALSKIMFQLNKHKVNPEPHETVHLPSLMSNQCKIAINSRSVP